MPKIYFYKLTVDNGGAPCVQDDWLSLALCKPGIRSTAERGDFLVGFAANSLSIDNRLIYISKVAYKIVNGDYFRLFPNRRDCVYVWKGTNLEWRTGSLYHKSLGHGASDIGNGPAYSKASALLCREFQYFGGQGTADYKNQYPMVGDAVNDLQRGSRVNHDKSLWNQLKALVEKELQHAHRVDGQAQINDTNICEDDTYECLADGECQ